MATIDERLKRVIVEQLGVEEREVVSGASFVDDLHADSFDLVKLLMGMEDEFQIKIKAEEMELLTTVNDAQEYLKQRIPER
jgi:acyl carrier protein